MTTVLLRLAGPMQAWGVQSRFSIRDTAFEPSKSGVVGLICAALGRPRSAPVDDLAALRLGVRVDREGIPRVDYQTAGAGDRSGVVRSDGSRGASVVSNRHFLADADFLVGLEGEDERLLRQVAEAVARPVWQLFLGRKGYVPGVPVGFPGSLKAGASLREALLGEPWPLPFAARARWPEPERLRLVVESEAATAEVRRDQPLGAAFRDRSFGLRYVQTELVRLGTDVPRREEVQGVPVTTDS